MEPKTRRRILEAYDEAFKLLGQPNFNSGIKYICAELAKAVNQLKAGRNRRGLEAMLTKVPEPEPDQLDAIIGTIKLLPYRFRRSFVEVAKQLPKLPGGRPRVLTSDDGKAICAQIGALLGQGVNLTEAVRRMAQQHGVGKITIRRIWQKRGKPTIQVEGV